MAGQGDSGEHDRLGGSISRLPGFPTLPSCDIETSEEDDYTRREKNRILGFPKKERKDSRHLAEFQIPATCRTAGERKKHEGISALSNSSEHQITIRKVGGCPESRLRPISRKLRGIKSLDRDHKSTWIYSTSQAEICKQKDWGYPKHTKGT